VTPKIRSLGFESLEDLWLQAYRRVADSIGRGLRLCSIGSGNCDLEVDLALLLRAQGIAVESITCLELNGSMLERGRSLAAVRGVASGFRFEQVDLNTWEFPAGAFDVALATHSLHHVVNLEHLAAQVHRSLSDGGLFLINDMIGRNGHQRWPEALSIVHGIWGDMPDRYKFNHLLRRFEAMYENWDCSTEGFEGVRAQDIVPVLNSYFDYEVFFPFANIIDVFVDRAFGHNFHPEDPEDVRFIQRVGELDDLLIDLGVVTPTHLIAVARKNTVAGTSRIYGNRTPQRSIRSAGH